MFGCIFDGSGIIVVEDGERVVGDFYGDGFLFECLEESAYGLLP